jgi:hypothetical protein
MNRPLTHQPAFYRALVAVRRQMLWRRLAARLVISGLLVFGIMAFGGWLVAREGIQETTALWMLALTGGLWLTIAGGIAGMTLRRQPTIRALAARVEATQPALFDTLNTAVEMVESPQAAANPFARRVLRTADDVVRGLPVGRMLTPDTHRTGVLVTGCLLLVLVGAWLFGGPVGQRAAHAYRDWRIGASTGLAVAWDGSQVRRGNPVPIRVEVLRWESLASIDITDAAGRRERHPLARQRDGSFTFTFHGLDQPLRFRLETPSLRSVWYEMVPRIPPQLDAIAVAIAPPPYTGMAPQLEAAPTDLRVPEGSMLSFTMQTRDTRELALQLGAEAIAGKRLAADSPARHNDTAATWQVDHVATQTTRWSVMYASADDQLQTEPQALVVIPDEPPAIAIPQPGKDERIEPAASLFLELLATDDYGVAAVSITFSVSGRDQQTFALHGDDGADGGWQRETRVPFIMPMASLEAADGDLISYWATVTDNRQPDAQRTRSEVYFIEVYTEVEPMEMEGMPADQERIDLRPHIEELKRLLRLSHRAATQPDDALRLELNQQLFTGYSRLREDVREVYQQVQDIIELPEDHFINRVFQSVDALLGTAARMVSRDAGDAAIASGEQALQELVALENVLRQNTVSRQSQPGDDGGESSGEPPDEPSLSDWQQEWQVLRDALAATAALQQRQSAISGEAGQAGPDGGTDPGLLAPLADEQGAVRRDTRAVGRTLQNVPATDAIQSLLEQAARTMRGAGAALEDGKPETAWRDSLRAEQTLDDARRLLEDRVDAAAREAINRLSRQAAALAEAQRTQAAASQAAQAGERPGAGLADEQRELNDEFQALLEAMQQLAGELPGGAAAAARALQQQAAAARSGDPGTTMTRAANALLYQQLNQALRLQDQAAAGLDAMAATLGDSARLLPGMDRAQLERLLSQLAEDQRQLLAPGDQAPDAARLQEMRDLWEARLERLAEALSDQQLAAIANALGTSQAATAAIRRDTADLLDQAAAKIDQYRSALDRAQHIDTRRRTAPPPDEYRDQVEAYFRRLVEEGE